MSTNEQPNEAACGQSRAAEGEANLTAVLATDTGTAVFEYETCMRKMDEAGVPRTDPTLGPIYTIWGRVQWMVAND